MTTAWRRSTSSAATHQCAVLCAFDLLEVNGEDISREPIENWKRRCPRRDRQAHARRAPPPGRAADGGSRRRRRPQTVQGFPTQIDKLEATALSAALQTATVTARSGPLSGVSRRPDEAVLGQVEGLPTAA
jgi:hypothetical protein